MLTLLEIKTGELEFSDQYLVQSRIQRVKMYQIIQKSILFLSILIIFLSIFSILPFIGYVIGVILLVIMGYIYYNIEKFLPVDLASCLIIIDKEGVVTNMYVQMWEIGLEAEYFQEAIRFNQAVGFKTILTDEELFQVVIIVHKDYPGDVIFQTEDIETLVEFKNVLNIMFPDYIEWYNFTEDGDMWDEELQEEFDEAVLQSKVPIGLRDYYRV